MNSEVCELNGLLRASLRGATLVPTAQAMLAEDATAADDGAAWEPQKRCFHADGLHLSESGYEELVATLCSHVGGLGRKK